MTEVQIPILVSSNEASGAYNVPTERNKFDVNFNQEMNIPREAKNITVEVSNATIWYTSFNISAALQNNIFALDVFGEQIWTVTIPDGLYDLSSFSHAINVGLVNQGLISNIVTFTGDNATQKVIINYSVSGLRVDFTVINSCRSVLGFGEAVYPVAYTTATQSIYGDTTANFNSLDYFLLHSDIVGGGIPDNGKSTSVVARVLITSPPGNQLIFEPRNPIRIPSQQLAGSSISRMHCWVTTQDSVSLPDLNNEEFSILFVIRYTM